MRDQIVIDANGKVGLQDVCGNVIISPQFDGMPERYSCFERARLQPVAIGGKHYLYCPEEKRIMSKGYNRIYRYFGAWIDYLVAEENGKKGVLDGFDGHELTPTIMDEIYEMPDCDGYIPFVKDGKAGFCDSDIYVAPIFERVEICSESYTKVWLNGQQGWLNNNGEFTINKDEAAIGSWYDYSK
jgi:hypothetical protein